MSARLSAVLVIAKPPLPGRVKTRLTPPLTPVEAASVAAAALTDTLRAVDAVEADEHVLAFDGAADGWLPHGWRAVQQPAGGLDVRLAAAFAAVRGPSVLVGMDTPQVSSDQISAFDPVAYDACLGLALDGGFWAIGFRDPAVAADVIPGVPMSTDTTGSEQLERMVRRGLRVQQLAVLVDVDTIETARQVAASVPSSTFAAALAATHAGTRVATKAR